MSLGAYLAGLALLALAIAPAAIAGRSLQRALLPAWTGAPAALAIAVSALGVLIAGSQLLGLAGVLAAPTLIALLWLLAGIASLEAVGSRFERLAAGSAAPPEAPGRPSRALTAAALALAAVVVAQWAVPTLVALDRGIYGGDSLWYHLPFAAHIAQTGSVTELLYTDPLYLNWFYPQNSELLGAGALLLFGNDFPAPLLNLGWLGLALLAGWCAGRPVGAQAPAMAAVAALMASDLMSSRQPGNANNDVAVVALFLAAAALLLNLRASGRERDLPSGGLLIAGLAAGLAVGVKLTAAVPVAALTIGVIVLLRPARRVAGGAAWATGLAIGGGYWFARNLAVAGTPLPWVDLGPLDKVSELAGRDPYPIVHYATDFDVWGKWFVPGLEERFGDLWPLLLGVAVIGAVAAIARGGPVARMAGIVAVAGAIGYLLTPLGAAGEEGSPSGFRLNIRYLAPALALALVLAARSPFGAGDRRAELWRWAALAAFALATLVSAGALSVLEGDRLAGTAALALAVAAPALAWMARSRASVALGALAAIAAAVALVAGKPAAGDYLDGRYALDAPGYPRDRHPATELSQGLGEAFDWARGIEDSRIALTGTLGGLFQYGLWGLEASNEVRYLGERGDRGSFGELSCAGRLVAAGEGFDYLVTTPDYDQDDPEGSVPPPERAALLASPAAVRVATGPLVDVWRLDGAPTPRLCDPAGR